MRDAIDEGHREVARWLRSQGTKIWMSRSETAGELCEYAEKGDIESIKLLTACGCDVQSSDYDKVPPPPRKGRAKPPCGLTLRCTDALGWSSGR